MVVWGVIAHFQVLLGLDQEDFRTFVQCDIVRHNQKSILLYLLTCLDLYRIVLRRG